MARAIDIAWAAGLFEGEGCIFLSNNPNGSKQARLEIRMTDKDVLERFCEIVGRGEVKSRDYDQAPNSLKRVYKWGVYDCDSVRRILAMLLPYLGNRRSKKAYHVLKKIENVQSRRVVNT